MIRNIQRENKNRSYGHCLMVFFFILIIGLPISTGVSYFLAFRQRVYPKISICHIPLTGKNKNQVNKTISSILKESYPQKIILNLEKEIFVLGSDLVNYQKDSTTEKSLRLGREKPFLLNLRRIIKMLKQKEDLSFDTKFNNVRLDSEIASISAKLYIPAIEPEIKIITSPAGKKIMVETGKNGREVNIRALKLMLKDQLACPRNEIFLSVPVNSILPKISESSAEIAKKRATRLLDKEIKLNLEGQNWTIDDEEAIDFLSFEGGFNKDKIEKFIKELAKSVNSNPENALFHFENNKVTLFKPSKEGIVLKENDLVYSLIKNLTDLEETAKNQEAEIPVNKIPAKISTGDANSLGIKELLGKGTSLFYGSILERIHNINLASLRLNGILVPSGETFSFNTALGDVSADTGFKQAYIIKQGRTILGDGGGVCQVSTTLFRAILNSGLPIIERHAHAYRVHYYEEDLGLGFDATVFDPTADLKFVNNTPAHILIQSEINTKKKSMSFEIYGTYDGRKVEISKVRVWDKTPPPPDLYQDDPTLPTGTIKQVDWKAWGAKAAFDYKVTRIGEVLTEKTFTSTYKPWQAVYLRGTGR